MEELNKVELVREKCNVTYEEAKMALEENDYDVLEAIVSIERKNAAKAAEAPKAETFESVAYEIPETRTAGEQAKTSTKVGNAWHTFVEKFKAICRGGMDMTFVAERNAERVFALPVLFMVLGLLLWGATLWLLIIGLFFGFRYHIEGTGAVAMGANEAMDKAADFADDIKQSMA